MTGGLLKYEASQWLVVQKAGPSRSSTEKSHQNVNRCRSDFPQGTPSSLLVGDDHVSATFTGQFGGQGPLDLSAASKNRIACHSWELSLTGLVYFQYQPFRTRGRAAEWGHTSCHDRISVVHRVNTADLLDHQKGTGNPESGQLHTLWSLRDASQSFCVTSNYMNMRKFKPCFLFDIFWLYSVMSSIQLLCSWSN